MQTRFHGKVASTKRRINYYCYLDEYQNRYKYVSRMIVFVLFKKNIRFFRLTNGDVRILHRSNLRPRYGNHVRVRYVVSK